MDLLFATSRIALWAAVLLFVLPRALFRPTENDPVLLTVRGAARVVIASVVIVHGLALVGMLDLPGLVASFLLIRVGIKRHTKNSQSKEGLRLSLMQRVQLRVYDVLDRSRSQHVRALGRSVRRVRTWMRRTTASAARLGATHGALAVVCVAVVAVHWIQIADYPYPDTAREYAHLLRLKALGAGEVLQGGYYPLGTHAFAEFLRSVTRVDAAIVWRAMTLVVSVLTVVVVYAAVRRFEQDGGGGATLAAALAGFAGASGIAAGLPWSTELHPTAIAAPIVVVLVIGLSRNAKDGSWPARWTVVPLTLLGFIHPVGWVLGAAATLSAGVAEIALARGRATVMARSLGIVLLSAVAPGLVIGASLVADYGFAGGALAVQAEIAYVAGAINPIALANAPLVLGSGSAAMWLLLSPRNTDEGPGLREHVPAIAMLAASTPLVVTQLGSKPFLNVDSLQPTLIPLASIIVGLAFNRLGMRPLGWIRRRFARLRELPWAEAPGMAAVVAVFLLAPPQLGEADAHLEPGEVLDVVYDIKRDFVGGEWTVVGHTELTTHAAGTSWAMNRTDFLEKYTVANYRWDPRNPEATIPTPHVFFVVEATTFPLRGLSETDKQDRLATNEALGEWLERYEAEYGELEVYYESDQVRVLHLFRSPDTERRALQRAWEEDNRR